MRILPIIFGLLALLPTHGAKLDFHRNVAPILREYCAGCHNEVDWEGEFAMETYKSLMKGGENGPGIRPDQ